MIQTEFQQDNLFQCQMHPEQSMKLICYFEKCPYKTRFLCQNCLSEENKKLDNIASLQNFIQDPISVLDKANKYQQLKRNSCEALLKQIDALKCLTRYQLQLDKLKVQVSCMVKNIQQKNEELLKRLQIHEFQQQLSLVLKMDSYYGTQEFALLEEQLNNIIQSWKECCQQTTKQIAINQKSINYNEQTKLLSEIQQDLQIQMDDKQKQEKNLFDNLVYSLTDLFYKQTEIPAFIHEEISKGKQIKFDLLFQGVRDGLKNGKYWQKSFIDNHHLKKWQYIWRLQPLSIEQRNSQLCC